MKEPLLGAAGLRAQTSAPKARWTWKKRVALLLGPLQVMVVASFFIAVYSLQGGNFWHEQATSYTFSSSLLDALVLVILHALLTTLTVVVAPSPRATAWAAAASGVGLVAFIFLLVKASLWSWGEEAGTLTDSLAASVMAAMGVLAFLQELLMVRVARAASRKSSVQSGDYAKLENEEWVDVESPPREATGEAKPAGLTPAQLFRILKPYFWPSRRSRSWLVNRVRCVSTWVFVASSKACSVISPIFIAQATTSLQNGDYDRAMMSAGTYCLLSFLTKFLKVKKVAYAEISCYTFEHLLNLSLSWHLKKKALLLFVSLALYAMATITITLWRQKFREATNAKDNEIHERATDSLINYETVKCFTNESYELSRYTDAIRQYQKYSTSTQASLSLLNIIQQVIMQLCCLGSLLITARAIQHGKMTVGDFVGVNIYVINAFAPLNYLGMVYTAVIKALVDMQNLNQLLVEKSDICDDPHALSMPFPKSEDEGMALSFQDVSFHYPEQPPEKGLKQVSFDVPAGTTTAIVGHTGSGKTTISRLMFRFFDPLAGRVTMNGHDIRYRKQHDVRGLIGVVPQDCCLFNDTILHNIRYGRLDATFEEVEAAAEAAQLRAFIESLPEKYNTMVGERGLKLSGGEKQRVAIARCLLKRPPLVLLDEATSALDTKTERGIQEALANLRKNRTTVIIAHRLSTIKHADQIIVVHQGRIIERGTHDDLLAQGGSYAEMWDMQLKGNEDIRGSIEDVDEGDMESKQEEGGGQPPSTAST